MIGEHWTLLIIRDAFFGLRRFDEFHNSLGISRNVLSVRLKKLVKAGILEKTEGPGHPEYRLTEKGLALQPAMVAMTHWGDTYLPHPEGKRLTFVDRRDGKPIKPAGIYAADGRRLKPKEIKAGKIQQRKRVKLSAKAALQRMQAFGKRREKCIAAIRAGKD